MSLTAPWPLWQMFKTPEPRTIYGVSTDEGAGHELAAAWEVGDKHRSCVETIEDEAFRQKFLDARRGEAKRRRPGKF